MNFSREEESRPQKIRKRREKKRGASPAKKKKKTLVDSELFHWKEEQPPNSLRKG